MDSARELEKSEWLSRALAEYRAFSSAFQALRDTDEIHSRMEQIRLRQDFTDSLRHEEKLHETETAILSRSRSLYQAVEKSPSSDLSPDRAIAELQIGSLTEKAGNRDNLLENRMANRVLTDISYSSERAGWTFQADKDH